jgi:phosphatidate cytidylyltransferase
VSQGRLAKVWRRTWIGGAMIAVLAGCLLVVDRTGSAWPISVVAGAMLLVTVWEVDRMGSLAGRGLLLALLPAALIAIAVEVPSWWALWAPGELGLRLLVLIAALLGFTGHNVLRHARGRGMVLRAVVVAAAFAFAWFTAHVAAQTRNSPVLVVMTALSAGLALWSAPRWAPRRPRRTTEVLIVCGLALWIVPPLPAIARVWLWQGLSGLLALLLLSKIGDIAGYYVGSAIGRHKIAPRISPGKTVEGCAASLIAGMLGGWACVEGGLLPEGAMGLATGPLVGASINLAAQGGDLLESFLKRRAGVKDSATWFGDAGGVLDVVDSLLLTVPVALLLWPLVLG